MASIQKPTPSKLKKTKASKKDQGTTQPRKIQSKKFNDDDDESLLDSELDFSPFEDEEIPQPEDPHPPPRRRRRSRTRSHRSQPRRQRSRQRSRSRRSSSGRRRSRQRGSKK